jgi:transcriptional regulator with XRE-family HTH domain
MAPQDKVFYQQLGQRIARLRKAQNLTQQQLAELIGVAQQTLAHYETGRLRIAVAALPPLAEALGVNVEELLDDQPTNDKRKRGPASKLQRQIELIGQLPRAKQKFVMEMLDTVMSYSQIWWMSGLNQAASFC